MIEKVYLIEDIIFKNLIQTDCDFYIFNDETRDVLRTGRIINFRTRLPFIYFTIEWKNKHREYSIPQPFEFKWVDNKLVLSYRINSTTNDKNIIDRMKKLVYNSESKIIDRNLYIEPKYES